MPNMTGNDIGLSKRNVKKLMRDVSSRVSDDASVYLAYLLEQEIDRMTRAANIIAKADGRETVREDDIRKAIKVNDIMEGGNDD